MNFKKILFLLVLCLIPIVKINAASFNVSSSANNVTVGSTVTIYINGSDVTGKVSISSSNASVLSSSQNSIWIEPSGSVTFKANKVGSATITVTSSSLADGAGNDVNLGSKSVTINVVNKSTSSGGNNVNKNTGTQKSSNNSLSSLSVEGASLNPDFESGTTEYSLTVKEGTETINVSATPQDSKASVNGTGNIKVSNGLNVIKVVVTAENGYEKTYLLNVTVEENPIIIEMDKYDYTLVRQSSALPQVSSYYSPTTIKYKYKQDEEEKEFDIPAYYSEITGYTLVGLKDEGGNIKLYIYDNGEFTLYNEINFNNNIILLQKDAINIPDGYKKTKIKINNEDVVAYQKDKKSEFYLIYGMNVLDGDIGWYRYDNKNMSIQRYDSKEIDKLLEINHKYLIGMIVMTCTTILLLLATIILSFKLRRVRQ